MVFIDPESSIINMMFGRVELVEGNGVSVKSVDAANDKEAANENDIASAAKHRK